MIEIAIVEDEKSFADQLTGYLDRYEEEEGEKFSVTVYRDGDDITKKYRSGFDIILMDIQMKLVDGMTAAEEIRKVDSKVIIMFITNMTQYAVRGYEVDALDYILKPVSYFAFSQKLKRAVDRSKRKQETYITLQIKGNVYRLRASDIYYIESEGHNLIYHTRKGEYKGSGTIKSVEEELRDLPFYRSNTCYIVGLEHVEGIQDKCAVVNNKKLQISRSRMSGFMQALTKYWGS